MYSATVRLISKTKAEAKTNLELWEKELKYLKLNDDGTIQGSIEEILAEPHMIMTEEIVAQLIDGVPDDKLAEVLAKYINDALDITYRQGVMSQIRNTVKFPFQE